MSLLVGRGVCEAAGLLEDSEQLEVFPLSQVS
jgi:hypothetical protein